MKALHVYRAASEGRPERGVERKHGGTRELSARGPLADLPLRDYDPAAHCRIEQRVGAAVFP